MTGRLADYVEAGYALAPDERLEAARMLRLSVEQETDSDHAEIDAAWDEVIDRRVAEVVSGTAVLDDGPESLAQIRAELAAAVGELQLASTQGSQSRAQRGRELP